MRSGTPFQYSTLAAGDPYVTVDGALSFEGMIVEADGVLGYVKSTQASDVCELVVNI